MKGLEAFAEKLARLADRIDFEMGSAHREAALIMQREVARRVPVRTGRTRDAFADPEAVGPSKRRKGSWRYGLITERLERKGYRARWIEYGTKGYEAGDRREYQERDKRGNLKARKRKIRRHIPARPAQPFFRPGIAAAQAEIEQRWGKAFKDALRKRG